MKELTPSEPRKALELRSRRMTARETDCGRLVYDLLNARRRKRQSLRRRISGAVAATVAAAAVGIILWMPGAGPTALATSAAADQIVTQLARAGIEGECTVSETRREHSDGTTVYTCRVVVRVSRSDSCEEILLGQKLTSVTATYDSISRAGESSTTLTTEMNYTGNLHTTASLLH